jgi:hypothetical protein
VTQANSRIAANTILSPLIRSVKAVWVTTTIEEMLEQAVSAFEPDLEHAAPDGT